MQELLTRALGIGVDLSVQIPSSLPPAMVDANQLELALLNLALNARDAMPRGGTVTINASEQTNAVADLSLPPGDYLRIKIADTGVGMDEATRVKAIEPFFTTKRTATQTGLGLSVVHGIAAQSGGLLRIESALDMGTTVELWLPQCKPGRFAGAQCRNHRCGQPRNHPLAWAMIKGPEPPAAPAGISTRAPRRAVE